MSKAEELAAKIRELLEAAGIAKTNDSGVAVGDKWANFDAEYAGSTYDITITPLDEDDAKGG